MKHSTKSKLLSVIMAGMMATSIGAVSASAASLPQVETPRSIQVLQDTVENQIPRSFNGVKNVVTGQESLESAKQGLDKLNTQLGNVKSFGKAEAETAVNNVKATLQNAVQTQGTNPGYTHFNTGRIPSSQLPIRLKSTGYDKKASWTPISSPVKLNNGYTSQEFLDRNAKKPTIMQSNYKKNKDGSVSIYAITSEKQKNGKYKRISTLGSAKNPVTGKNGQELLESMFRRTHK